MDVSAFFRYALPLALPEEPWDVFAVHVADVELSRQRDSIRMLDIERLSDRDILVEHAVDSDVARSSLMDQALDWHAIEVRLDPMRVERRG